MGQDEIRPFDGDLTFIGKIMASLPIDIELSRLIALGHAFGLVYECVVIAASLSTKSIFKSYYQDRLKTFKFYPFLFFYSSSISILLRSIILEVNSILLLEHSVIVKHCSMFIK